MKHLFSVHSPITFLVAYCTIKHLKIPKKDVLIISANYKILIDDYQVIQSFTEARNKGFFQKIKHFNVPKSFDRYLNSYLKGEQFIAYIDLMSYFQKMMVSHKKCIRFHFIEEGNSTYQLNDDLCDMVWPERNLNWRQATLSTKSLLRVLRGYNLKLLSLPYNYAAYAHIKGISFYAFSENAFYNIPPPKKVIIKPPTEDNTIKNLSGNFSLSNQTIWLDGSNSKYTGLEDSFYVDAIKRAIPLLKEKGLIQDSIYVKLRPGTKSISNNSLVSILQLHQIQVKVLPDEMIIEAFLMRSSNCNLIGVLTSVLEYAHVFGHKAYSIYSLFEKQPPTFFDRMTGFWNNIHLLTD